MKIREKLQAFKSACTWENCKCFARRWGKVLLNPRLLLCLFIAWMITNGWSYIFFGIGMWLKIRWMRVVGAAYMSLLWLPFTPEKLITVAIALFLLRVLYPKDQRTLAVLKGKLARLRRQKNVE